MFWALLQLLLHLLMLGRSIRPARKVTQYQRPDRQSKLLIPVRSEYNDLVTTGLAKAFDFNQAAIDALNALEAGVGNQPADVAKSELLDYIFASARPGQDQPVDPNNPNFKRVKGTFQAVKSLAPQTGTFYPQSGGTKPNVVTYCDFSRFSEWENKGCDGKPKPGYACDKHVELEWPMSNEYHNCKYPKDPESTDPDYIEPDVRNYPHPFVPCGEDLSKLLT